jgi:hypothetical protein
VDYATVYELDLDSPDCDVRRRAVEKLAKVGDKGSLAAIRAAAKKDDDETVVVTEEVLTPADAVATDEVLTPPDAVVVETERTVIEGNDPDLEATRGHVERGDSLK